MNNWREKSDGLFFNFLRWNKERRDAAQVSAERSRVQKEAKTLASLLLKIPREGKSVLHEKSFTLSDGMRLHIVLCNTANAISLEGLLSARHEADRVEAHLSGARGYQSNYNITLGLREQELDYYSEYVGSIDKLRVVRNDVSDKKYAAYKDGIKVPFDKNLQRGVYRQVAEIFQKARTAFR